MKTKIQKVNLDNTRLQQILDGMTDVCALRIAEGKCSENDCENCPMWAAYKMVTEYVE